MQHITTKPNADYDTDHELLVATLKLKMKHKKKFTRPIRYDLHEIKEEFNCETNKKTDLKHYLRTSKKRNLMKLQKRIFMETAENTLPKDVSKSSHG